MRGIPIAEWPGLEVEGPVAEGNRSSVWRGVLSGQPVAVRRSSRSLPSLDWELDLLRHLSGLGFLVPAAVPTRAGALRAGPWSVQTWIEGRPPTSEADWRLVAAELERLHRVSVRPQRPGAVTILELEAARRSVDADLDQTPPEVVATCLAQFAPYRDVAPCLIHGDPGAPNLRITDHHVGGHHVGGQHVGGQHVGGQHVGGQHVGGQHVGLLDWDEARVDVADLDLANLGVPVLTGERRRRAEAAAHAWETLNGWLREPDYAASRFRQLDPGHQRPIPSPE